MKILKPGRPNGQWWVGKRIACRNCGQVHELEKDDDKRVGCSAIGMSFMATCMNCEALMGIECCPPVAMAKENP